MVTTLFIKGFIVSFAMAVPIGPVGILCIRKTLAEGHVRGRIIGLAAATADLLYGCVAAFGLTVISGLFADQLIWLRPVGAVILLVVGISVFRARPADPEARITGGGLLRSYASTILLTLTNPLTMFGFLAAFAALGLGNGLGMASASVLVSGVFAGTCSWFFVLILGASIFRKRVSVLGLRWVNRIAGVLIMLSSVLVFVRQV